MKDLCKNCSNKDNCVKLCEKAKKYANQDNIKKSRYIVYESELYPATLEFLANTCQLSHQEMINSGIELGNKELIILKRCNLTERQFECMYLYYWKLKTQENIAIMLNISRRTVREHLKIAADKLLELLNK